MIHRNIMYLERSVSHFTNCRVRIDNNIKYHYNLSAFIMTIDDDYHDGFSDYVPTTTDPGPWMLLGVSLYSISCVLFLPICVFVGKRRRKKSQAKLFVDALIADIDLDKDDNSYESEEMRKEGNDDYATAVDLGVEGHLKNKVIDLSYEQDIEDQKNHTNLEFVAIEVRIKFCLAVNSVLIITLDSNPIL